MSGVSAARAGVLLRAVRAALLLACVCRAASAFAQEAPPTRLDLQWQAAEGCPDQQSATASIEALLGEQPAGEQPGTTVRVQIDRLPSGQWEARITTPDREIIGERVLQATSCELLAGAAALIVAIALDPVATAERMAEREREPPAPPAKPLPDPAPAPPPRTPTARAPAAAIAEATDDTTRLAGGLRVSGDLGSLPGPSLGIGLALDLLHERLLLQAEATAWLPRVALRGPVEGSGGEIGLYSGALRGCLDLVQTPGRGFCLAPCLAAEAGLSTGIGFNLTHPERSHSPWVAGLAGLAVRQRASGLFLWALLEAGLAIRRPIYAIDGFERPVFQASPVLGRVSLGVAWTIF